MSLSHMKANGKKRIQNNLSQPKKGGGKERGFYRKTLDTRKVPNTYY